MVYRRAMRAITLLAPTAAVLLASAVALADVPNVPYDADGVAGAAGVAGGIGVSPLALLVLLLALGIGGVLVVAAVPGKESGPRWRSLVEQDLGDSLGGRP